MKRLGWGIIMNDYYNRFRIVFKKTGMNVKRRSGTFDEKVRTFSCQMEDYEYLLSIFCIH
jgi:hypothetical protein